MKLMSEAHVRDEGRGTVPACEWPALVRLTASTHVLAIDGTDQRRRLVANLCRLIGERVGTVRLTTPTDPIPHGGPVVITPPQKPAAPTISSRPHVSPRATEVLSLLLRGESEKRIARQLQLSPHTVHHHVKAIYRAHDVTSRAELLARCLTI